MPPTRSVADETLAAIGRRIHCYFGSLESDARSHEDNDFSYSALKNESQRFGLWARNLGLYSLGHSSLDYRFRDAPVIYQYTRHLLVDLEKSISQIQYDLSERKTKREVTVVQSRSPKRVFDQSAGIKDHDEAEGSDESSEEEEDFMSYQEESISAIVLENARLIIDRLYKLSFQIRNPATRLGFSRARNYRAIDEETGVNLLEWYTYFDLRHVTEIMARYWRIPPEECENHSLVQRLARANTNRRRQFGAWRRHKLKQENESTAIAQEMKHEAIAEAPPSLLNIPQASENGALSLPSTATRLDENTFDLNDTASAMSTSTYAIMSAENDENNVSIASLPENLRTGKEFECPFCYVLCSRHTADKAPWERHVFKDLRPYVCTYEDCAEGDQQYDSFGDWVSHEVNTHRDREVRPASFSQQSPEYCDLNPESPGLSQPLTSIAPDEVSRRECPICLEKNPTFYHIGLHLRRFAAFALPNAVGTDEDEIPGDQGSDIADLDEEMSVSSQSISTWVGKDSMHENDEDGEVHERSPTASETQKDASLLQHALRQIDGVFDESDMERYFAGLASENTLSYREKPMNADPPSQMHPFDNMSNISFYVLIDGLEPNYQAQTIQYGPDDYWVPPTIRTGYTKRFSSLFYWRGGIMTHIPVHEAAKDSMGHSYSAATIFTRNPDTPHLLVVPFDARTRDVSQYPGGWRPFTFRHIRIGNTQRTYSAVLADGDRQNIAARGSSHWMPQLLPSIYDKQSWSTRQAGLIGSLPLLIALAAFSAPASFLQSVLTLCLRLRRWNPHQYQYPAGHTPERGMVVTVFYDPSSPEGSNRETLEDLENGEFGPFYS